MKYILQIPLSLPCIIGNSDEGARGAGEPEVGAQAAVGGPRVSKHVRAGLHGAELHLAPPTAGCRCFLADYGASHGAELAVATVFNTCGV